MDYWYRKLQEERNKRELEREREEWGILEDLDALPSTAVEATIVYLPRWVTTPVRKCCGSSLWT